MGIPVVGIGRLLPAPVRGILWKDFLLLRRDLRNLSQLISPLIFGVIYSFMFFDVGGQPPAGQGEAPDWFMNSFRILLSYGNVGMSLFVGWWLLARLSGMAFSSEGKNYWMLKAAPVRAGHLLMAKFLVAYLPTLVLGLFFLAGISIVQKIPLAEFLYSLLAVAMCLAGMNGILLAFGVLGANFKWEDPRKMSAGKLGLPGPIPGHALPADCLWAVHRSAVAGLGFQLAADLWLPGGIHPRRPRHGRLRLPAALAGAREGGTTG